MATIRIITAYNTSSSITECVAKEAPTAKDIKETKILFRDFYILEDVPTFQTLAQLIRWRSQRIKKSLGAF